MSSLRDQLRAKCKEAAERVKTEEAAREQLCPSKLFFQQNDNRLNVYKHITLGHVLNEGTDREKRIQGATDVELQSYYCGIHPSTIRFERWQLEKAEWIKYAGFKRALVGKIKAKVWIVTDKYLDYIET